MCAIICVLFALPAAEPNKDELIKKELANLQGTWLPVSAEVRGEKFNLDGKTPESFNMVISDNVMRFGKREITFTIDPTTDPKQINLTHPKAKAAIEAIYRIDGDKLTLCYRPANPPVKDRPTAFKTDGKGYEIRIYKREKPKK